MTFLSIPFFILITVLLILIFFIKNDRILRFMLLIAGYLFYACFDIRALILLISLSLFTWLGARLIAVKINKKEKAFAKGFLITFITAQVLILAFFKYAGFFSIPVGLSFYILQAISLLVDVYSGDLSCPNLMDSLIYISFFPVIVSGQIGRAHV